MELKRMEVCGRERGIVLRRGKCSKITGKGIAEWGSKRCWIDKGGRNMENSGRNNWNKEKGTELIGIWGTEGNWIMIGKFVKNSDDWLEKGSFKLE